MKRRLLPLACALLLCLALLPGTALADAGPKPVLTILVQNAPAEPHYLDLLIREDERGTFGNLRDGLYDQALLEGLRAWESEGWYPAFSGGTRAPLFGDLLPGEAGTYRFTYFGLPETFRIAVSTASGSQATDVPFTRTAFYTNLVYDYASNTVAAHTPGWAARVIQFLFTFLPTLIVEGILLLAFGFHGKRNWLVFFLTNLVTQVGLHLAVGSSLISASSHFFYYLLILFLPELVIFLVEAVVYALLLKGRSTAQRVGYALTANAASLALGFLPLRYMLDILKNL